MAVAKFWRFVGFETYGAGAMTLTEAQLYDGATRVDASAAITCTVAPITGVVANLADGSTATSASWGASSRKSPGFAIEWEFATAVNISGARIGSVTRDEFPFKFIVQWSDNGTAWTHHVTVDGIAYAGDATLTPDPALSPGDPTFDKVILLLRGDGENGSTTILDSGPSARAVSVSGGAYLSNTQVKFDSRSIYFDGVQSTIVVAPIGEQDFRQDWSIRMWVYRATAEHCTLLHIRSGQSYGYTVDGHIGIHLHVLANGALVADNGEVGTTPSTAGVVPVGAWKFVELVRESNVTTCYVDTVSVFTHASQMHAPLLREIGVGRFVYYPLTTLIVPTFYGYMDDVRVTLGDGSHASTLPTGPAPGGLFMLTPSLPTRLRHAPVSPIQYAGSVLPDGASRLLKDGATFFDAYNGGLGTITGTVKEKNTPANTPLRRRVLLIDEASRMTIRETWSDPVTGVFEFRGIKQGVKYSTISYDHLHNYRAVIADNQDAA